MILFRYEQDIIPCSMLLLNDRLIATISVFFSANAFKKEMLKMQIRKSAIQLVIENNIGMQLVG